MVFREGVFAERGFVVVARHGDAGAYDDGSGETAIFAHLIQELLGFAAGAEVADLTLPMGALEEGVDFVLVKPYAGTIGATYGFVLGIAVVASVVYLHSVACYPYFGVK